jgi:hypothetical protein
MKNPQAGQQQSGKVPVVMLPGNGGRNLFAWMFEEEKAA